jgi:hypothetical protein
MTWSRLMGAVLGLVVLFGVVAQYGKYRKDEEHFMESACKQPLRPIGCPP